MGIRIRIGDKQEVKYCITFTRLDNVKAVIKKLYIYDTENVVSNKEFGEVVVEAIKQYVKDKKKSFKLEKNGLDDE